EECLYLKISVWFTQKFSYFLWKELDYAEKENTIAKALEDLKANFYCELCDKQYYKHQEFDNHINSYDHAHKQRLKELKQREFARNVASKSRKDERKQEKALQRLHKLAELRKETVCAPGSGPMFKSTTVTVKENCSEISQRVVVDPVNNQEDFKYTLIHSEETTKDVTTVAADPESANNHTAKNNQRGDQAQGIHRHKIGFSFAFPKKASVKLESSAAAFSEYNDDASVEKGFSRKSRFVPGACHLQLSSPTDVLLSSEEKANSFHPPEGTCADKESAQTQEMKEVSSEKDTFLLPSLCQFPRPLSSDVDNCQNSVPLADQIPLEDAVINEDVPMSDNGSGVSGRKSTGLDLASDGASLQATTEENGKDRGASVVEGANKDYGPEMMSTPSNSEEENITLHKKSDLGKRPCEPFVPVLNKDGSTVLQWPSEMLSYTATQPPVSYSCNPLCFDFKATKLNSNLDKNKLPSTDPPFQQKAEDICKRPVSESKSVSPAGHAGLPDGDVGGAGHECSRVAPLLVDDTPSNSCRSGKNETPGQRKRSVSCRIRKTKKYKLTRNQVEQDTLDEKYTTTRSKGTHEHWFRKSRRKKKRKKLCQRHRGEKTKEPEIHFKVESGSTYTDPTGKNPPETSWGQRQVAAGQPSDSHQLPGKRPKPWSPSFSDKEGVGRAAGAGCPSREARSSRHQCARDAVALDVASSPGARAGRRSPATCGAPCGWRPGPPTCDPLPRGQAPPGPHSQAVKRGYHSLLSEPERPHRKRRPHSSYSSDESLSRRPSRSPEEMLRAPRASGPRKPKRKRRRKRGSRFHVGSEAPDLREEGGSPSRGDSPLGPRDEAVSEASNGETKPQGGAGAARRAEQARPASPPGGPLPPEARGCPEQVPTGAAPAGPALASPELAAVYAAGAPSEAALGLAPVGRRGRGAGRSAPGERSPLQAPGGGGGGGGCRQRPPGRLPAGILGAQDGPPVAAAEPVLAPLAWPEAALLVPVEPLRKLRRLPCELGPHLAPGLLAAKVKLAPAGPPPALGPLHAAPFKALPPPPGPGLARPPLPLVALGLPPLAAPPLPVLPASALPAPLACPALPRALFPSLLPPHAAVIPLQPLF
uniref:Zinc finger protein 804A n=1 Tax=Canis lupus dingo TaxID=286419 RepID=A0A8C0QXM7_CANLU